MLELMSAYTWTGLASPITYNGLQKLYYSEIIQGIYTSFFVEE